MGNVNPLGMLPVAVALSALLSTACRRDSGPPLITNKIEAPEVAIETNPDDWPWWRGLQFDGKSADEQAPTRWSPSQNVLWKADLPGRGHSSPIVSGDRVFVTTADEQAQQQLALGLDRTTGKILWRTVVHEGQLPRMHAKNSHASATPACDGQHVYCVFVHGDGLHVTAIDRNGSATWTTNVGQFGSEHGYGSSPVLYKSLLIVNGDNLKGSFVAALHRGTGQIAWKAKRRTTRRHGSYATPIVAHLAGRDQLILSGMGSTSSYAPETGELLWTCEGPTEVTACTPAFSETLVFSSGGYPGKEILAIRADGSGDVTASHVAWRSSKGVTYVPSPLLHEGQLYVVADNGVTTCFEAATGKQIWQARLDGDFSASPVLVGDLIYATNERGRTFVAKTGAAFELVAQNDLADGGGFASPVICGGRIYLRTDRALFCVGEP